MAVQPLERNVEKKLCETLIKLRKMAAYETCSNTTERVVYRYDDRVGVISMFDGITVCIICVCPRAEVSYANQQRRVGAAGGQPLPRRVPGPRRRDARVLRLPRQSLVR